MSGAPSMKGHEYQAARAVHLLVRAILDQDEGAERTDDARTIQLESPQPTFEGGSKSADIVVTRRSGAREWFEAASRNARDSRKPQRDVRDMWLGFLARRRAGEEHAGDRYVFVSNRRDEGVEESVRSSIRGFAEATDGDRRHFLGRLSFEQEAGTTDVRELLARPPWCLSPPEIDEVLRVVERFVKAGDGPAIPIVVRDVFARLEGVVPAFTPPPDEPLPSRREDWWVDRSMLRSRLDDIVAAPGPVLVTGEAGAGKSTLVDAWVRRSNEEVPGSARRMPAGLFADADAVRRLTDRVRRFGRRGGRVFVVDGLDELWDPSVEQRAQEFIDAVSTSESPRLVVVARSSDAERLRSPLGPDWRTFEIPELSDDELDHVVARIGGGRLDPLSDHPKVRDLVRNPFRLRLLVATIRRGGEAVWTRLDAATGPSAFLCEFWRELVQLDPRNRSLDLDSGLLRLAHRLAADGVDRVGRLARGLDLRDESIERARSLGILAEARDLAFSSRVLRDFALALAFDDEVPDPSGIEWLRSTRDERSKVIVLRHWVGIEWWRAKRGEGPQRVRETWIRLVRDLPPNLAVEAAEGLSLLLDPDDVSGVFEWTQELPPFRRREVRAWMLRLRTFVGDGSRRDLLLDGAWIDAVSKTEEDRPYAEAVELACFSVGSANEAGVREFDRAVVGLFEAIQRDSRLSSAERSTWIGRLFHVLVGATKDDGEQWAVRCEELDVGDPWLAREVLDALPALADTHPRPAVRLWQRCVETHLGSEERDGVLWSADRAVGPLLSQAPGAMAAAVVRVFEAEGRRADDSHDARVREISAELGLDSEDRRWEAEVLDGDLRRWLDAVRDHAPAIRALAEGVDGLDPADARSQVRAVLFDGAVRGMSASDENGRETLGSFATCLVERLTETDPPATRDVVGRVLVRAADDESTRLWALDVARGLSRVPSVVVHLREADDERARELGERAAASGGVVRPRVRVSGGAGPPPPDDEFLRQMDRLEKIDESTLAYRETYPHRVRLIGDLPRIEQGQTDASIVENVCCLDDRWSRRWQPEDLRLRAKLERELAAVAEGWASHCATLGTALEAWVATFLVDHAGSHFDDISTHAEEGDDLGTVVEGTRARCARGLLALARARELKDEELRSIVALAIDASPHVRAEVARGVSSLHRHHADAMWEIANGLATREEGHAGSAVVLWLLRGLNLSMFAAPDRATDLLRIVWSRRARWSDVGALGSPQRTVADILPTLAAHSGDEDAGRLLAEMLGQVQDPAVCEAMARGASSLLENAVRHPDVVDIGRAAGVCGDVVRAAYGGSTSFEPHESGPFDASQSVLVVGLVRLVRTEGAYERIPATVWEALRESPPDFGSRVVRDLVWLAEEVLPLDPERALMLVELAILRTERDLLDERLANSTALRVVAVAEAISRRQAGDDETKHRLLRLLGAFARFQIGAVRGARERILVHGTR